MDSWYLPIIEKFGFGGAVMVFAFILLYAMIRQNEKLTECLSVLEKNLSKNTEELHAQTFLLQLIAANHRIDVPTVKEVMTNEQNRDDKPA